MMHTMGHPQPLRRRLGLVASVTAGLAGALLAAGAATGSPEAASLAVLSLVGADRQSLGGLVGSIAAGALAVGALAWLVAEGTGALPMSVPVATGLGLAVGGGLGSLVWLLATDEAETDATETVTVDMAGEDGATPTPEPVDLFEASPDPILYYAGEGPAVRAVNPAFEAVFGVDGATLEDAPLAEGLQVAEAEAVVEAARAGDAFDEVVACETADGERRMRLRVAATGGGRTEGYVLYGAADRAGAGSG